MVKLYHSTDMASAKCIQSDGYFRSGKKGFAGGAIYFSANRSQAIGRCRGGKRSPDVVIVCEVDLGRTATARPWEYRSQPSGFDSVRIGGKDIYAVYSSDRVRIMEFTCRFNPSEIVLHQSWPSGIESMSASRPTSRRLLRERRKKEQLRRDCQEQESEEERLCLAREKELTLLLVYYWTSARRSGGASS